jgi:archaellum component FlaC
MKMQELAKRLTLPPDQVRQLGESIAKLVVPGEQLNALVELADTFGPPVAQLEQIRSILAEQREQVQTMLTDLDRLEDMVQRLTIATEQITTMQAPLRSLLERLEPGSSSS